MKWKNIKMNVFIYFFFIWKFWLIIFQFFTKQLFVDFTKFFKVFLDIVKFMDLLLWTYGFITLKLSPKKKSYFQRKSRNSQNSYNTRWFLIFQNYIYINIYIYIRFKTTSYHYQLVMTKDLIKSSKS